MRVLAIGIFILTFAVPVVWDSIVLLREDSDFEKRALRLEVDVLDAFHIEQYFTVAMPWLRVAIPAADGTRDVAVVDPSHEAWKSAKESKRTEIWVTPDEPSSARALSEPPFGAWVLSIPLGVAAVAILMIAGGAYWMKKGDLLTIVGCFFLGLPITYWSFKEWRESVAVARGSQEVAGRVVGSEIEYAEWGMNDFFLVVEFEAAPGQTERQRLEADTELYVSAQNLPAFETPVWFLPGTPSVASLAPPEIRMSALVPGLVLVAMGVGFSVFFYRRLDPRPQRDEDPPDPPQPPTGGHVGRELFSAAGHGAVKGTSRF